VKIETVIGRFREPPRSASYDCRPRWLRAACRGCRPGAAGHDARWNLNLKRRTRSAVRYAEDDECPAGCGHPEPAVLADWQLAGLVSAVFLCDKESGIPGQAATGRVSIASRASSPCVGLDPSGLDHSDFPGPAGRPIAGPSHLTVNRASRARQPNMRSTPK
jgi:hypothetical protein